MVKGGPGEKSPGTRTKIIGAVLLAVMTLGSCAVLGLFAAQSTETLIVTCLGDGGLVPASVTCAVLEHVRDPDPNHPESGGHPQTVFGFAVAGHDASNPRSVALIEHFIERGVQWDGDHDRGHTPLHMAVLFSDEALVTRFLQAGASPEVLIDAPGTTLHGMNSLEFARLLLSKASESAPQENFQALLAIESLLETATASPAAP